jgi:glycosyltransferase involved in cell wall biosynthesis
VTRLKLLKELTLGTPVVSTSKGAEGLEVTYGEDILTADAPVEFADAVLRLLDDRALRQAGYQRTKVGGESVRVG